MVMTYRDALETVGLKKRNCRIDSIGEELGIGFESLKPHPFPVHVLCFLHGEDM